MGVTGYEVKMYADISSIAKSLEQIAASLKEYDYVFEVGGKPLDRIADALTRPGARPEVAGPGGENWPPKVSLTYECPSCSEEIDIRKARAL